MIVLREEINGLRSKDPPRVCSSCGFATNHVWHCDCACGWSGCYCDGCGGAQRAVDAYNLHRRAGCAKSKANG